MLDFGKMKTRLRAEKTESRCVTCALSFGRPIALTAQPQANPGTLIREASSLRKRPGDTQPVTFLRTRRTPSQKCDASYRLFAGQRQVSLRLIRLHGIKAAVARRCASW